MHRARAFFFVCAGIFLLALAYHLGAQNARAQVGGGIVASGWRRADGYAYAFGLNGAIYANPGYCGQWRPVGHLPAGEVPVSVLDSDVGGSFDVMCQSGNLYMLSGDVPTIATEWCSSVFGSPTPAAQPTWGQVKAKYGTPAPGGRP